MQKASEKEVIDTLYSILSKYDENYNERKPRPYLGLPNFKVRTYNSWADDDLVYTDNDGETWTFNNEDISGALWDAWRDEHPNDPEPSDDVWENYVRDNVENECLDAIYGGYFTPGSHSWHDAYK